MRQELGGSLEFSYFSDKPEIPTSPISQEDEILLNSRDDQGVHRSPPLSFSSDRANPDFTIPTAVESDRSHRVGRQTDASLPPNHNNFDELLVPPGAHQHLSAQLHSHLHGTSSASSTTSNSFVHLTPQGSLRLSSTLHADSEGVLSLASNSAGRCSPRTSTPSYRSHDSLNNSRPAAPSEHRPRVGPSQYWDIPPKVSIITIPGPLVYFLSSGAGLTWTSSAKKRPEVRKGSA